MNNKIIVDKENFELVEEFNDGKDVSVLLRNGDTINIYFDKQGNVHVTMQNLSTVRGDYS